jgi:enterobactin synthetase component D
MDPTDGRRYQTAVNAYSITLRDALPHGVLIGVALPPDRREVPESAMASLLEEERALAANMEGFRKIQFVGGRIAAREAVRALDLKAGPILQGARGAPAVEGGAALSISHKRHLAIALAARAEHGALGVDLEALEPERKGVADRVLTPEELEHVQVLPPERQWTWTVVRFAIKEAIYKSLAPRLQRYIGFHEAIVTPHTAGLADVELRLDEGPEPTSIQARFVWMDAHVLATVRVRW